MSQRLNNLNSVIAIVQGGAKFYRSAAGSARRPEARQVFEEHAAHREQVAAYLSDRVERAGHEPASASALEIARLGVTKATTPFDDTDLVLARGLLDHEDRTLAEIDKVVDHPDSTLDRDLLLDFREQFALTRATIAEALQAVEPREADGKA